MYYSWLVVYEVERKETARSSISDCRSRNGAGPLSGAQRWKDAVEEGLSSSMLGECRLSQINEERVSWKHLTSITLLFLQHCLWLSSKPLGSRNIFGRTACLHLVKIEEGKENPWARGTKQRPRVAPRGKWDGHIVSYNFRYDPGSPISVGTLVKVGHIAAFCT